MHAGPAAAAKVNEALVPKPSASRLGRSASQLVGRPSRPARTLRTHKQHIHTHSNTRTDARCTHTHAVHTHSDAALPLDTRPPQCHRTLSHDLPYWRPCIPADIYNTAITATFLPVVWCGDLRELGAQRCYLPPYALTDRPTAHETGHNQACSPTHNWPRRRVPHVPKSQPDVVGPQLFIPFHSRCTSFAPCTPDTSLTVKKTTQAHTTKKFTRCVAWCGSIEGPSLVRVLGSGVRVGRDYISTYCRFRVCTIIATGIQASKKLQKCALTCGTRDTY